MPIVGIIPETENVFAGLPRIAKLRKGAPKETRQRKDGSTYEVVGRDLDHLRVAFDPEYEHLHGAFTELYGKQPAEFTVFLNADSVHEAFDFWKEEWTATVMLRRCDGQHKHVWYNERTGFYQNAKVLCDGGSCGCKEVGRLNVILPDFTMKTGVLGYFTIETHSTEDIRTLYARITSIWATFGKLRGVPLVMYRVPRKMSVPEIGSDKKRTGKRMNKSMHMLDMRVDPEYTRQHLLAALTQERSQLPAAPVSTISLIPDRVQAAQTLGTGGLRRLETGANQNGHGSAKQIEAPAVQVAVIEPPPVVGEQPSDTTVKHWSTDLDDLCGLADRCYENKFIGKGGAEGIPGMEALIAPKHWTDFPERKDAALAVKAAFEELQRQMQAAKLPSPAAIPAKPAPAPAASPAPVKPPEPTTGTGRAIDTYQQEKTQQRAEAVHAELDTQAARAMATDTSYGSQWHGKSPFATPPVDDIDVALANAEINSALKDLD